jgi:hypothetical protein
MYAASTEEMIMNEYLMSSELSFLMPCTKKKALAANSTMKVDITYTEYPDNYIFSNSLA